ncbi:hypothetical protein [Halococcus sp. PRR34]|uniref:hypothetical protein n=1 Tax=Halococcus sp. PRR34 TaxID=3020830 RepID=UPI002362CD93|nr:hypothetical protein [Halococcus sp. PRR34]
MRSLGWKRILGAIIGVFCLWATVWAVPELLIDYFTEDYRGSFLDIVGTGSLVIEFLVLGSIGMSLLTGEFYAHKKVFLATWLVVSSSAFVLILWVWSQVVYVQ